jgi:hypothetical protein
MNRTKQSVIVGAFTLVLMAASVARAAEKSNSAIAFERLTSLVGEWKGVQDGTEIKLTYTLTANGPVMVTMFSVDGDHLIATHYCSARNQPQMATEPITEPKTKRLTFSLVRVTGMATPDDWHNTGLVMVLEGSEHLTQEWKYQYKGETGTRTFHYTRER